MEEDWIPPWDCGQEEFDDLDQGTGAVVDVNFKSIQEESPTFVTSTQASGNRDLNDSNSQKRKSNFDDRKRRKSGESDSSGKKKSKKMKKHRNDSSVNLDEGSISSKVTKTQSNIVDVFFHDCQKTLDFNVESSTEKTEKKAKKKKKKKNPKNIKEAVPDDSNVNKSKKKKHSKSKGIEALIVEENGSGKKSKIEVRNQTSPQVSVNIKKPQKIKKRKDDDIKDQESKKSQNVIPQEDSGKKKKKKKHRDKAESKKSKTSYDDVMVIIPDTRILDSIKESPKSQNDSSPLSNLSEGSSRRKRKRNENSPQPVKRFNEMRELQPSVTIMNNMLPMYNTLSSDNDGDEEPTNTGNVGQEDNVQKQSEASFSQTDSKDEEASTDKNQNDENHPSDQSEDGTVSSDSDLLLKKEEDVAIESEIHSNAETENVIENFNPEISQISDAMIQTLMSRKQHKLDCMTIVLTPDAKVFDCSKMNKGVSSLAMKWIKYQSQIEKPSKDWKSMSEVFGQVKWKCRRSSEVRSSKGLPPLPERPMLKKLMAYVLDYDFQLPPLNNVMHSRVLRPSQIQDITKEWPEFKACRFNPIEQAELHQNLETFFAVDMGFTNKLQCAALMEELLSADRFLKHYSTRLYFSAFIAGPKMLKYRYAFDVFLYLTRYVRDECDKILKDKPEKKNADLPTRTMFQLQESKTLLAKLYEYYRKVYNCELDINIMQKPIKANVWDAVAADLCRTPRSIRGHFKINILPLLLKHEKGCDSNEMDEWKFTLLERILKIPNIQFVADVQVHFLVKKYLPDCTRDQISKYLTSMFRKNGVETFRQTIETRLKLMYDKRMKKNSELQSERKVKATNTDNWRDEILSLYDDLRGDSMRRVINT